VWKGARARVPAAGDSTDRIVSGTPAAIPVREPVHAHASAPTVAFSLERSAGFRPAGQHGRTKGPHYWSEQRANAESLMRDDDALQDLR